MVKAAATATDTPPRTISLSTAKALIRRTITDSPSNRPRTVYENFSWKADCIATSNRADDALLACLRAGHTPLLKAYAHLLDPAADPTCPLCKEECQCTPCNAPSPPLEVLTTDPENVLTLARAAF